MPAAKRRDPSARLGMPPKSQNRSGGDMRRFVKSKDVEKKPQAWAVGLDKWTLSFSNSALDGEWRRLVAGRSRALWLRSLLSATLYQALRHAADAAQFGPAPQWVVGVRLVLAVTEVLLFAVAYCDLLRPSQAAIAANAFLYGIVELALVVDRLRPRVAPGDWLHVTYGLAWFIVPKMSALQFFPACLGSCAIVGWWSLLSLATMAQPPPDARYGVGGDLWRLLRRWAPFTTPVRSTTCTGVDCVQRTLAALEESSVVRRTSWQDASAGLALVVPVVVLFNVVAYSSEKSVKERFVLRSALAHEHRHDVRLSLLGDDASQMLSRLQDAVKAPRFRPPEQRTDRLLLAAIPAVLLAASGYFPSIPSFTGSLASSAFGGPDAAWAALSHVFGLSLFLLVLTKRVKFLLLTPLVVAALFYLAAQTLVETDSRTKLFRWAGSVVLAAFVLGAFRVARLFAALLHFARRTLFLYPHLEENLKEHSDGEVLGRLVAKVELPRPNNPGAVRGALDTTTQNEGESEQSLCSLGSYKSEESRDGPLPVLPLGSHDRACAFCSHDPGGTSCSATHAVPVCGAWASWYLWRAERAKKMDRARNEVSSPVDEGPSLRPCCDFATLALERSALQRENASLRAQIASLRARERSPPSSPPDQERPLE